MQQLRERKESRGANYKHSKYSVSPRRDGKSPIRPAPKSPTPQDDALFGSSISLFGDESGPIRQGNIGGTNLVEIEENSNDSYSNSDEGQNSNRNRNKNKKKKSQK